jgi:hypothetical protein
VINGLQPGFLDYRRMAIVITGNRIKAVARE